VSVDKLEVADLAGFVGATLARERLEETRGLPDEELAPGAAANLENPPRVGRRVDQRFGADHVLAGLEGLRDLRAVDRIGRIDGDDVNVGPRE